MRLAERSAAYPVSCPGEAVLQVLEPEPKPRAQASGALDILNPRYTLHVVVELDAGERHFNDLSRSIPASTNTLSQRLRLLENQGIVSRRVISEMPRSVIYRLTKKGRELARIVRRIGQWDAKWSTPASYDKAMPIAAEARKPFGRSR